MKSCLAVRFTRVHNDTVMHSPVEIYEGADLQELIFDHLDIRAYIAYQLDRLSCNTGCHTDTTVRALYSYTRGSWTTVGLATLDSIDTVDIPTDSLNTDLLFA